MDRERLISLIEAIIFVSGDMIDRSDIKSKLDILDKDLDDALSVLKEKYSSEKSGVILVEAGTKLQFATRSDLSDEIMMVISPIRERILGKATIETLAIIAYSQPITRLEIEEIRGASSDYTLSVLMEHKLIEVVGRKDAIGRPLLFGTTDEFLRRFNLKSIKDLPSREELLNRIKLIKTNTDNSLYNNFEISEEEIVPERLKEKLNSIKLEQTFSKIEIQQKKADDDFV